MSRFALVEFRDADAIRDRLPVLYLKVGRIVRFMDSCAAGHADVSLLDEKQQAILAALPASASAYAWACRYRRTCGLTIDILESRLHELERRERRAERAAARLERRYAA